MPFWGWLAGACGTPSTAEDGDPDGSGTDDVVETGTRAHETAETAHTGVPTDPTCPACDDGFACTIDRCDALGACGWEPVSDCPWPAPVAVPLVDGLPELQVSLSGATWDPVNGRLWVVRNSGPAAVWRLVPDGLGGVVVDEIDGEPAAWVDVEGLGQLDVESLVVPDPVGAPDEVFLVDEQSGSIVEFDLSVPGVATLRAVWDVAAALPTVDQLGAEAIAFVPDAVLLRDGFVDGEGLPRTSTLGMGGLVLVGHQNGGRIYAFDLGLFGIAELVGVYDTGRRETAGLELDPETGRLYVWHGVDNDLELVRLASTEVNGERVLVREHLFDHPAEPGVNLEGVAVGPCDAAAGVRPLYLVTDDGGPASLAVHPDWPCLP